MAWDVNPPSSFLQSFGTSILFFSPLGGSRYNLKSMCFGVRLPWVAGVEYEGGVSYRRHWGEKGEGDMSLCSV